MATTHRPTPRLSADQVRNLVDRLNALGQHVRHGDITEYEARILLSMETRPMDDRNTHPVLTRLDHNLLHVLEKTPVASFSVRYDESEGDIALVFDRQEPANDTEATFTI
jgi:hypothetical protein